MLHALVPSPRGTTGGTEFIKDNWGPVTNSPQIPSDQTGGSCLRHVYAPKSAVSIFYDEPKVSQTWSKWQTGTYLSDLRDTHSTHITSKPELNSQVEACKRQRGGKPRHALLPVRVLARRGEQLLPVLLVQLRKFSWGPHSPHRSVSEASRQKQTPQQLLCIPLGAQKVLSDRTASKAAPQPTYKPSPWQGTQGAVGL